MVRHQKGLTGWLQMWVGGGGGINQWFPGAGSELPETPIPCKPVRGVGSWGDNIVKDYTQLMEA